MITYNSSYEEINHHMQQMQMVVLSEKEEKQIKKILELKSFLETDEMKAMIAEDLKDEKWIQDTKILIDTAAKKANKNNIIIEHLGQCHNLLIYKILEKKCRICSLEMNYSNKEWIINEVEKNDEKSRWINQKFTKLFNYSLIEKIFIKECEKHNQFKVDLDWLHKNRDLFFTDNLFENLNFTLLKKNNLKI